MGDTRDRSLRTTDGVTTSERPGRAADASLVDAIARHDEAALAEAYRQHASRVHALARGLCGDVRAEDLTQEIFLQLWNNPLHFDAERGSLRSYLLMQAHARAVDILRSDNARVAREVRESADSRRTEIGQPGTEALALALLERAEIAELLDALPTNERHPIVLAYFGGHSYRDVARLLGVPEGTVKGRIRTGLKRLSAKCATRPDAT